MNRIIFIIVINIFLLFVFYLLFYFDILDMVTWLLIGGMKALMRVKKIMPVRVRQRKVTTVVLTMFMNKPTRRIQKTST